MEHYRAPTPQHARVAAEEAGEADADGADLPVVTDHFPYRPGQGLQKQRLGPVGVVGRQPRELRMDGMARLDIAVPVDDGQPDVGAANVEGEYAVGFRHRFAASL